MASLARSGNGFLGAIQNLLNRGPQPERAAAPFAQAADVNYVPSLAHNQDLTNVKVVPNSSRIIDSGDATWDKGVKDDSIWKLNPQHSIVDKLKASQDVLKTKHQPVTFLDLWTGVH
jgi:hypothetical protein